MNQQHAVKLALDISNSSTLLLTLLRTSNPLGYAPILDLAVSDAKRVEAAATELRQKLEENLKELHADPH